MTDIPVTHKRTRSKPAAEVKAAAPPKRTRPGRQTAAPVEPMPVEPMPTGTGPEPASPSAASGVSRREVRLYRVIAAMAGVVAVLFAAGLLYSVLRIGNDSRASSLRSSALTAGATYGVWLSSYNYTNLTSPTSSWTEAEAHSTASFKASFDKTKTDLTSLVKDYDASASGKVVAAGVSSLTGTRAVVLLFIDQTVTNKTQKSGPTTQPLRVQLVLTRAHGQWLIDDLQVPS